MSVTMLFAVFSSAQMSVTMLFAVFSCAQMSVTMLFAVFSSAQMSVTMLIAQPERELLSRFTEPLLGNCGEGSLLVKLVQRT